MFFLFQCVFYHFFSIGDSSSILSVASAHLVYNRCGSFGSNYFQNVKHFSIGAATKVRLLKRREREQHEQQFLSKHESSGKPYQTENEQIRIREHFAANGGKGRVNEYGNYVTEHGEKGYGKGWNEKGYGKGEKGSKGEKGKGYWENWNDAKGNGKGFGKNGKGDAKGFGKGKDGKGSYDDRKGYKSDGKGWSDAGYKGEKGAKAKGKGGDWYQHNALDNMFRLGERHRPSDRNGQSSQKRDGSRTEARHYDENWDYDSYEYQKGKSKGKGREHDSYKGKGMSGKDFYRSETPPLLATPPAEYHVSKAKGRGENKVSDADAFVDPAIQSIGVATRADSNKEDILACMREAKARESAGSLSGLNSNSHTPEDTPLAHYLKTELSNLPVTSLPETPEQTPNSKERVNTIEETPEKHSQNDSSLENDSEGAATKSKLNKHDNVQRAQPERSNNSSKRSPREQNEGYSGSPNAGAKGYVFFQFKRSFNRF